MTLFDMVMVGIGGFLGAIIRYVLAVRLNRADNIPTGTLLVNLAGAFLIGIVFGLDLPMMWKLLLASGFAGALTTFSTLNKELIERWRKGEKQQAASYFLVTYGGGIILVVVGYVLGGRWSF